jgi:hypothetical protein
MSLHLLKTLPSHLHFGLPIFRQPSGWEKVIVLQGEFSSILTKCPSHLVLATFITLTIYRSLCKLYIVHVRFPVLTAASMKFRIVFWDVLSCKIIVDRRFRGTFCSHHQGWSLGLGWSLMMEAACTSETSVDNYFTRRYIPEDNSVLYSSSLNLILQTQFSHVGT